MPDTSIALSGLRGGGGIPAAAQVGHAGVVTYERLWERLLGFLNTWAEAREVGPGRVEIVLPTPEGPRTVEVVITPGEWDDLVTVVFGDFDPAAELVRRSLLALEPGLGYLVHRTYELVPSAAPILPEDPDDVRMEERARRHPEGFGRWSVQDDEGNTVEEFQPPE